MYLFKDQDSKKRSLTALGGMVQPGGAGDAGARVPGAQALVPAVALGAARRRAHRARAQDGLDQDAPAARRREAEEEGQLCHITLTGPET